MMGTARDASRSYEIRMSSELEPVETVLHGPVRDQTELHGRLDRIQALGLELLEVRRLPVTRSRPAPGGAPSRDIIRSR